MTTYKKVLEIFKELGISLSEEQLSVLCEGINNRNYIELLESCLIHGITLNSEQITILKEDLKDDDSYEKANYKEVIISSGEDGMGISLMIPRD